MTFSATWAKYTLGEVERELEKINNFLYLIATCFQGLYFDSRKQRNPVKSDLQKLIFDSLSAICISLMMTFVLGILYTHFFKSYLKDLSCNTK